MRDTVPVGDGGVFELPGMFGERVLRVVGDTQGWTVDMVTVGKQTAATIVVQPSATIADVAIVVTR
jgi:hypothetical protein